MLYRFCENSFFRNKFVLSLLQSYYACNLLKLAVGSGKFLILLFNQNSSNKMHCRKQTSFARSATLGDTSWARLNSKLQAETWEVGCGWFYGWKQVIHFDYHEPYKEDIIFWSISGCCEPIHHKSNYQLCHKVKYVDFQSTLLKFFPQGLL